MFPERERLRMRRLLEAVNHSIGGVAKGLSLKVTKDIDGDHSKPYPSTFPNQPAVESISFDGDWRLRAKPLKLSPISNPYDPCKPLKITYPCQRQRGKPFLLWIVIELFESCKLLTITYPFQQLLISYPRQRILRALDAHMERLETVFFTPDVQQSLNRCEPVLMFEIHIQQDVVCFLKCDIANELCNVHGFSKRLADGRWRVDNQGFLTQAVLRFGGNLAVEEKDRGSRHSFNRRLWGDTIRSVIFSRVLPVLLDLCLYGLEGCVQIGPIQGVFVNLVANLKWKIQD